jgi:transcriptional adapter 3
LLFSHPYRAATMPPNIIKIKVPKRMLEEFVAENPSAATAAEDTMPPKKIVTLKVSPQALKELIARNHYAATATENKQMGTRVSLRLAKRPVTAHAPEWKKTGRGGARPGSSRKPKNSEQAASAAENEALIPSEEAPPEAAPARMITRSLTRSTTPARSSPLRDSSGGKAKKRDRDNDSTSSSLSPVAPRTPSNIDVDDKAKAEVKSDDDESSSDDDGRPPPQPRPQANIFGDDPSTFPDPTVYEILPVKPGMTEDEIKEIYSVATYPKSDLADLIAGDPPDKDFSSAKPTNQINFSTFSTYIEPFFRPFTEEDLAFLRERGDRVTPFVMPKRGKKHYSEIWAEEDGAMAIDSPSKDKLPPNQPRGSIENMDDDLAETDKLSVGPLLSRLLSAMRPEHRAPPADASSNGVNGDGDTLMNGVANFDFSFGESVQQTQPGQTTPNGTVINGTTNGNGVQPAQDEPIPPATQMPESNSEAWKKATHPKLDYQQVDERLKQELRHIGFLPSLPGDGSSSNNAATNGTSGANGTASSSGAAGASGANGIDPSSTADYDGAYDDEVAARLRLLQTRLREQALVNGARKSRLTDLVKERMAHQEYQTILEDLDSQVQAAYLKRTRTMGKKPKKARPGAAAPAAAAGGLARPGIGDLTKTLMERRRRWIENIGTVFDGENLGKVPRMEDEGSSIFRGDAMAEFMKRERENWEEEVEDE